MVPPHGFEPRTIDYKSIALPTELQGHLIELNKLNQKTIFINKKKFLINIVNNHKFKL